VPEGEAVKVPLMRDTFLNDRETRARLAEFVATASRLSMGEQCEAFESEFAAWQGREYAVLFNSGSSANLALIQALLNIDFLSPGDKVGVSAVTWATNVMPLIQLGLEPVIFGEEKNAAAFVTHPLGYQGDPRPEKILLEDTCEALGSVVNGRKLGNLGLASTFSFYVGHHLSTIEGGMVCTDSGYLDAALKMVRAHGWDRNLSEERQRDLRELHQVDDFHAPFTFYELGFNLRPTEITGFLGRVQLPLLSAAIQKRRENFLRLAMVVNKGQEFKWPESAGFSPFCFPIHCFGNEDRAKRVARFREAGVEVRPIIAGNIQRHPFWKTHVRKEYPTPEADRMHDRGFYCTVRPDLTEEEMEIVEGCLR
jgi:CDP-6-deoxy-D-xylo-4-hexulose-3-dehydrase